MRRRSVFLRSAVVLSIALFLVLLPRSNALPSSIDVTPASTTVTVGQSFIVNVTLSYAANLWAYQVDLTFDNSKLHANYINDAGYLGTTLGDDYMVIPLVDNPNGIVSLGASRLKTPAVTGGSPPPLAIINFTAIAPGMSSLHISKPPSGQTYLLDDTPPNGQLISYETTDGTVTIKAATQPVGGEWAPIEQVQLLTPWISQIAIILAFVVARGLIFRSRRKSGTI